MTADPAKLSAALLDLIMLAFAAARETTEAEFSELLDQAGLRLASMTALTIGPTCSKRSPWVRSGRPCGACLGCMLHADDVRLAGRDAAAENVEEHGADGFRPGSVPNCEPGVGPAGVA